MELTSAPAQLVLPWGNGDSLKTNPIPVPSQIGIKPGAASWTDGWPPLCATPVTSGGVPPAKADANGALFQMSAVDVWMCAGAGFPYNSVFSAAIGGYPKGARVLMASGLNYWRSVVDNNATDPDTGGAGWISEQPTIYLKTGDGTTSYSTTSSSFVDVDAANLALTVTIPVGFKLVISATGGTLVTAGSGIPIIGLYDSFPSVILLQQEFSGSPVQTQTFSLGWVITGDGNTHTVKLQFHSDGATTISIGNNGTLLSAMTFVLMPSS